jgi:hypothetical protein
VSDLICYLVYGIVYYPLHTQQALHIQAFECFFFVSTSKFSFLFFVSPTHYIKTQKRYGTCPRRIDRYPAQNILLFLGLMDFLKSSLFSFLFFCLFCSVIENCEHLLILIVGFSVADPGCLSRIPDPTFLSRMPDPNCFHPGSISKNLSILTQKKVLSSKKYDPGCSSRIPDPDPDFLPIPDPGFRGQKGTGSRIRICNTGCIGRGIRESALRDWPSVNHS